MYAVVRDRYSASPVVVRGPYPTMTAAFKGLRCYIAGPGEELCEWLDGIWVALDLTPPVKPYGKAYP